jgi:hypothetical protein
VAKKRPQKTASSKTETLHQEVIFIAQ